MAKFSIFLLLFVILDITYGNQPFGDSCAFRAHKKCWNASTEKALSNLRSFPDEVFLKENCDAIIEQLDCLIEEEKDNCPSIMMFIMGHAEERFTGLLSLKHFVDDVCDEDSSLRKDYIQTILCLEEHGNELDEDIMEIDHTFKQFYDHTANEEISLAAETLQCVEFSFVANEMKKSVEKHCCAVALKTVETILNYVVIMEPDHCLEDQENIERLTELLQAIKSSSENIAYGNQRFDESCAFRAYKKCWNLSTEKALSNLRSFPDEAFLKENCDAIIEQLDCLIEEEKDHCPSMMMFIMGHAEERFAGLLGLKHFVDDVCDEDSSLRRDYIKTIGCLDEHGNEFDEYIREIGDIFNQFYDHPANDQIRQIKEALHCVEFSFIANEMKNSVENHCGPVALKTVETILNYLVVMEPDQCLEDQENIERLTELLQGIKSSRENVLEQLD